MAQVCKLCGHETFVFKSNELGLGIPGIGLQYACDICGCTRTKSQVSYKDSDLLSSYDFKGRIDPKKWSKKELRRYAEIEILAKYINSAYMLAQIGPYGDDDTEWQKAHTEQLLNIGMPPCMGICLINFKKEEFWQAESARDNPFMGHARLIPKVYKKMGAKTMPVGHREAYDKALSYVLAS